MRPEKSAKEQFFHLSVLQKWKTHCVGKFFLRNSSGDIEKNFAKGAKNIVKRQKISTKISVFFFRKCPKMMTDGISQKITFLTKKLHRERKEQFWWNCFNILPECIKVLTQCPEKLAKHTPPGKEKKSNFPLLCRKQLSKHCRKTNANRRNFFADCLEKI